MAVDEIVPSPWIDDRHNGQCSYAINDVSPSLHLEVHLDAALYCTFSLCSLHIAWWWGTRTTYVDAHVFIYILNIFFQDQQQEGDTDNIGQQLVYACTYVCPPPLLA